MKLSRYRFGISVNERGGMKDIGQKLACALTTMLALVIAMPVSAQPYPTKPIRIIVPFGPGGVSDIMARVVGVQLQAALGQPVLVENRVGAGGSVGTDVVAKSPPDGYTLLMGTIGTQVFNTSIYSHLPYDPVTQFAPIAFISDAEGLLAVNVSVPASTPAELIALARKHPNTMNFASGGAGTSSHLAGELFKSTAKVDIAHVPYRSNAAAVTDVAGGQATMGFIPLASALPFIKINRLKAIATIGSARSLSMPQVPTLAESGLPGFDVRNWCAIFAPSATPAPIVAKLSTEIRRIMKTPEIQAHLVREAQRYTDMTPDELGKFVQAESVKWTPIVKASGAKAD
ncbi:MAG: protein bugT-like protein [Ramlibacter sp.]|nr:protein bugT-like protein [Ramlibacter sp.]